MEKYSIFNDVLGPVMRGPSSSHTAGSYHIGRLARALFGSEPRQVDICFDPDGSYAQVYRQQGADRAFAAGLMAWDIADDRFFNALALAKKSGIILSFQTATLQKADHPNSVQIRMVSHMGEIFELTARSVGGGRVQIIEIDGWALHLTGKTYETLVELNKETVPVIENLIRDQIPNCVIRTHEKAGTVLLQVSHCQEAGTSFLAEIGSLPDVASLRSAPPLSFVCGDHVPDADIEVFLDQPTTEPSSLGEIGLKYESRLLGKNESDLMDEMIRRFEIMSESVEKGLDPSSDRMQLLEPSAGNILRADADQKLATGGLHLRAGARAMAVMHTCNSMGVVCAAPTGGSAGVIPGVVVSLVMEKGLSREKTAMALFAASVVGLLVLKRATFAAEVAGCQVEIGAAGAMAAAAVIESAGGTARQALDAAAVFFQNTMGSVCDLVQGMCEIPCHTRNAVAASGAFVCADLILGGYHNPIPLVETIDAVYAVGKMLPRELRCTVKGGLALTPSAKTLKR